jgi:ankyrin repeat protein/ketosteroid isomerase-like protein
MAMTTPTLTRQTTEQVVRSWYNAIRTGDGQAVLAGLSPDVEFVLPDNEWNRIIDYVGTWRGREAAGQAFALRAARNEILAYEIREVLAGEGLAFVVCFTRARHLGTGQVYEVEDVHRVVLDEDRLVSHWTAYFDPTPEIAVYLRDASVRLADAVIRGDEAAVRELLASGVSPNDRVADGRPLLQVAAGWGSEGVVAALLEAGALVDAFHPASGNTALHVAAQGGHPRIVRRLLAAGATIDATTPTMGHTPLMEAVWYRWPEVVSALLDEGANPNIVTRYGSTIRDRLRADLESGGPGAEASAAIAALLDVHARAAAEHRAGGDLVAAILAGDAMVGLAHLDDAWIDRVDPVNQAAPLFLAAREGLTELVAALLARGADPNRLDGVYLASPLHLAAYNGHDEALRVLVGHPGTDIDLQGPINGYAPIHDAAFRGERACVEVLLEAGARTDLRGHDGRTPAQVWAAVAGPHDPLLARLRP